MHPIQSVSILMPTWQGMEFLPRVLDALAVQEIGIPWDFMAIDSQSKDGTWEYLNQRAKNFPVPFALERIDSVEFDHGDTRNLLAARSKGDLLVFLTQDAIPSSADWLARLASNFEDTAVGGAYCRNVARPDAELLTRLFSDNDLGYSEGRREERIDDRAKYDALNPTERRLLYNFNDVASALRRELWERHPFPRAAFGEDILQARALLEAGFTVVYDDQATVEHSHDYGPDEMLSRARTDARFNAQYLDRICVERPADVRHLVENQLEKDILGLRESGLDGAALKGEMARARELRTAAFQGLYEGGLSKLRFGSTHMLESTKMHILYVVHGFPPDTWAGTEIFTYNIAKEMERRGHRCTILHRAPEESSVTEGGPADFSVEVGEFQGLRVLRWVHRLDHRNLRESYQNDRAEEVFARILAQESPDIVHFQHLIHTSAGLVGVAKRHGLPTIVHCHDYWALCARVQLIRPDGEICSGNQGAGCFPCVKDKWMGLVSPLAKLNALAGPMLSELERDLDMDKGPLSKAVGKLSGFSDLAERHDYVTGAYASADLRISPSRFLRSKYLESGAFNAHSFLFSDNGMRTDHVRVLNNTPDPKGRVRFGFVGSLVWYKGSEVMVRAMQSLDSTKAVLNVYGSFDPETDEHHAELQTLAEGHAVEFKGRFDNARLSEVYAEIDVLIVPSVWYENSPITIHEAFLTETPVLASDIGGMAEFVKDGVDGLHFRVGDADDLAAKMQRFVDEPNLVEDLSQNFMRIKTIAENGEELEFRYRGLLCMDRSAGGWTAGQRIFGAPAASADRRFGEITPQGADMLLLRPGADNAIEFDINGCGGGAREITVTSFALGEEVELHLGGRLLIDGKEVGTLPDLVGRGADETHEDCLVVDLASDAGTLRLEPGQDRYLRICSVEIHSPCEEAL
ncbi:MAG: glycosyltransferase involved in cell wall biosynthesis/GT2 family glycosyltransferase [Planctomycetota bacterium]|jgi:glycosyltransferase involved in cell wall biosynthesis/GT2 family glycosyltransferase